MKLFKTTPFFLALLPMLVFSQSDMSRKFSPYTKQYITSWKKVKNDPDASNKLKANYPIQNVDSKNYIKAFIELNANANLQELQHLGVNINTVLDGIITVQIPTEKLEEVSLLSSVKRIHISTPTYQTLNKAREVSNVDKVHQGAELAQPFTGNGVIVGIIDGGFDYNHINFVDPNKKSLRIAKVWDQNLITNTPPDGFSYGTEFKTEDAILEQGYDENFYRVTHGTHVAGIAGGSDKTKAYYGVAPDAEMVLVSYSNTKDNASILDGIKYIYDYAESMQKPCVVNLSIGSQVGPHDGTSIFDRASDQLQGKGRLLVGAIGNDGVQKLHIERNFQQESDTLRSYFDYAGFSNRRSVTDIWGDVNKEFSIGIVVYSRNQGKRLYSTPILKVSDINDATYALSGLKDGVTGTIAITTEIDPINNRPNAYVTTRISEMTYGDHYLGLVIIASDGSTVHAWNNIALAGFTALGQQGWVSGNADSSAGEIGGSGKRIITVGAYESKDTELSLNGMTISSSSSELQNIASFSSKGPTIDNRMKPDISAPGTLIVSSYSRFANASIDLSRHVDKTIVGTKTHYYGILEGTSMAAPFVTGTLATWLEAYNDLSPEDVREIFSKTAINDQFTGDAKTEGSNTWGYGKVDSWNGIKESLILAGNSGIENQTENPKDNILFYPNPNRGEFKVLFLNDDSNVRISIYSITGKLIYSDMLNSVHSTEEHNVSLRDAKNGVYIVSIQADRQSSNHTLIVQ